MYTACNSDPRTIENLFESGVLLTEGLEKMETRVKREKAVDDLQDAHNYILDVCDTLSRFVALYPPAAAPIARSGLIARLAHVFERVLSPLCVALGQAARRKHLEKGIVKLAFTLLKYATNLCVVPAFALVLSFRSAELTTQF